MALSSLPFASPQMLKIPRESLKVFCLCRDPKLETVIYLHTKGKNGVKTKI